MDTLEDRNAALLGSAVREWARRFGLESEADLVALASELRDEARWPVYSPLSERESALIADHVREVPQERRLEMARSALATKAQLDAVALSSQQAARQVRVSAPRLRQLADEGRIWAYRDGSQWRIPLTQFHEGELLPGWEQVWAQIPDSATPVSVYRFLTIERDELRGWSVRDWLAAGEPVDPVLDLVRGWYGP
ncbi:MAG: excisionase family DNA-binding protein [Dietzia sp.]|nr:excisionase family DNA-binding protein [Dietzia sp.]